MRPASLGKRQALCHDRVDLALAKQLEQGEEVLPVPLRVAGASTHWKRMAAPFGNDLVSFAQLLDPVYEHPSAGREQGRLVTLSPTHLSPIEAHETGAAMAGGR